MGVVRGGRRRRAAAAALLAGILLLAAACGGDDDSADSGQADEDGTEQADASGDDDDSGDDAAEGEITLVLDTFSEFGYEDLIEQYMEENPDITIEHRKVGTLDDHRTRVDQYMAAGDGAGDVIALEGGQMQLHRGFPENYENLLDYGAADVEDNFLPWVWENGMTSDGAVLGLGTDVGPMAMAYRTDLFEEAGLPTDRDEVSALWPTWGEYVEVGEEFMAAGTGPKFVDALTQIYNSILNQGGEGGFTYYDEDDNLVVDSNPVVQEAWDVTMQAYEADLSAGLVAFQEEWEIGFAQDSFATIPAPAWMLANIEQATGEDKAGLWDIAAIPGGGGNWGGSFLAVPSQTEHPQEAADLAMFLTSVDSHVHVFQELGNFPSSVAGLEDESVQSFSSEYFSDAPVGEIFSEGAQSLEPVYFGPNHQPVREEVDDILDALEEGQFASTDEAWEQALAVAERVG